jgi:hypothetical protein
MRDRLSVVVCTRDRPNHLFRLLDSMVASVAEAEVGFLDVLVIDDSTANCVVDADALRSRLTGTPVKLTIIGSTEFDEFIENVELIAPELAHATQPALKRPGTQVWSPGGARNIGFLFGAASDSEEPLLFIDDDIVFGDVLLGDARVVQGDSFARVLAALFREAASPGCRAVGVRFVGCPDLSLLSHLEFVVESLRSAAPSRRALAVSLLSEFPQYEPTLTQLTEVDAVSASAYRGPGGISAGVMLVVDRLALSEAPQPTCYNEDWIWLQAIGSAEGALRRADVVAAHVAEDYEFDTGQLLLQERGELLYDAMTVASTASLRALRSADVEQLRTDLLKAASFVMRERSTRVDTIRRAVRDALGDGERHSAEEVRDALDHLDAVLGDIEGEFDERLAAEVVNTGVEWVESAPAWRDLCCALREHCEILPVSPRF